MSIHRLEKSAPQGATDIFASMAQSVRRVTSDTTSAFSHLSTPAKVAVTAGTLAEIGVAGYVAGESIHSVIMTAQYQQDRAQVQQVLTNVNQDPQPNHVDPSQLKDYTPSTVINIDNTSPEIVEALLQQQGPHLIEMHGQIFGVYTYSADQQAQLLQIAAQFPGGQAWIDGNVDGFPNAPYQTPTRPFVVLAENPAPGQFTPTVQAVEGPAGTKQNTIVLRNGQGQNVAAFDPNMVYVGMSNWSQVDFTTHTMGVDGASVAGGWVEVTPQLGDAAVESMQQQLHVLGQPPIDAGKAITPHIDSPLATIVIVDTSHRTQTGPISEDSTTTDTLQVATVTNGQISNLNTIGTTTVTQTGTENPNGTVSVTNTVTSTGGYIPTTDVLNPQFAHYIQIEGSIGSANGVKAVETAEPVFSTDSLNASTPVSNS